LERLRRCDWRREAGYSLLELLITLVLVGLALALANGLLLEAAGRAEHRHRETLEPLPELAARQLVVDLRMARGVETGLVGGWSRDALILLGHPSGDLRYARIDDTLLRLQRVSGADPPWRERPVLTRVTRFRWRVVDGSSVEVELRYRHSPRLRDRMAGGWRSEVWVETTRRLRVTPRAGREGLW
jgi:prepilin-type N-terminal cleavage/methylation domain-containing protein